MPNATNTKHIVQHCSAGFSGVESIERFWAEVLGWNGKGYHTITELDGTIWYLKKASGKNAYSLDPKDLDLSIITNGVRGYNDVAIHNCTIGGVDPNDVTKALDTRTNSQKRALHSIIQMEIAWLEKNGKDITKDLGIHGHRDFSIDKNKNGVIESWERMKECPSWDVMTSYYHKLYSSADRYGVLPYN